MGSWVDNMPKGMFLKSAAKASSFSAPRSQSTLAEYLASIGHPPMTDLDVVPLQLFVDYGKWFQQRHVPDVEVDSVEHVQRSDRGFELELGSGERLNASAVVVASGHVAFANVPGELRVATPDGPSTAAAVSHASQWADFRALAGRRAIVIGSGQSAMESAVLLAEEGAEVWLVARSGLLKWATAPSLGAPSPIRRLVKPPSDLGPGWSLRTLADAPQLVPLLPFAVRTWLMKNILGPSGGFWLRERFEGTVKPILGRSLVRAHAPAGGGVRLELNGPAGEHEVIEADHLIAGTGYRIDVESLRFLDPKLRADLELEGHAPRLDRSSQSSIPGLFFTGLSSAPTFGPLLRFVAGTRFAAPRIAAAIAGGAAPRQAPAQPGAR
jgi:hypothetical protein